MAKELIISRNWWKEAKKWAKSDLVQYTPHPIKVEADFDKDGEELLKTYPMLKQQLMNAANAECDKLVSDGGTLLRGTEWQLKKVSKYFLDKKDLKGFMREFQGTKISFVQGVTTLVREAKKRIEKAIVAAMKAFLKLKKDVSKYKLRVAAKIGLKLGSLGIAIAGLVSSSGANVVAWRTLIKDMTGTYTEARAFMASAESFRKKIDKNLKSVQAWHAKLGDGAGATASEVGLGLLKVLIGTDGGKTLDALGANAGQYRKKLQCVELKAHETAAQLNLILNRAEILEKETGENEQKTLEALRKKIQEMIDKVHGAIGEIETGVTWADEIDETIADLKAAKNVRSMGLCIKALDTASDLATTTNSIANFVDSGGSLSKEIHAQAFKIGKNVDRWEKEVRTLVKKVA